MNGSKSNARRLVGGFVRLYNEGMHSGYRRQAKGGINPPDKFNDLDSPEIQHILNEREREGVIRRVLEGACYLDVVKPKGISA